MAKSRRNGFTFVELMVAMALLGLLSAMAIPRFRNYKERSYVAAMRTDLGHLRIALEEHFAEHQRYTTDTTALDFRPTSGIQINLSSTQLDGGYRAVAQHVLLPNVQCSVAAGSDAVGIEAGSITCAPTGGGSSTIPSAP